MQNAPRSGAFLLDMFNYFLRAKNELKSVARKNIEALRADARKIKMFRTQNLAH
jgi:hypothetical protein